MTPPPKTIRNLGRFIAVTRRDRGLTAAELAGQAGVPATWLRSLENGRIAVLPPPGRLRSIATALGVTPRDLLIAAGYLDAES